MRQDVVEIRAFYATPLGETTADLIAARVARLCPPLDQRHIAGLGYAAPLLDRLPGAPASRVALMPAPQGVSYWPAPGCNAAALVEETDLPIPDGAYDLVVMAHSLELADDLAGLLREAWRILNPGGRLIAIVPKRRGTWSSVETTPFGHGRPYSARQLERLMTSHLLPVARCTTTLFIPPVQRFSLWKAAPVAERVGQRLFPRWGGLLVVVAEKQLEGGVKVRPRRVRTPAPTTVPAGAVQRANRNRPTAADQLARRSGHRR